jgi:membrane protease YdiL (CAAX protease family)
VESYSPRVSRLINTMIGLFKPRQATPERPPALPFRAVIPGLVYILIVDLAAVCGYRGIFAKAIEVWGLVLALIPWVTLLVLRLPARMLGYRSHRALAELGWGMVAGALSLCLGLWWLQGGAQYGWGMGAWIGALVWIPFVEETFFRGYLCRALADRIGRWPAIFLQALLFSLHPGHWAQGLPNLISIVGFGILSGWLVESRNSIWPAIGAHAFANGLPEIFRMLV